jgi:hypothetical protein
LKYIAENVLYVIIKSNNVIRKVKWRAKVCAIFLKDVGIDTNSFLFGPTLKYTIGESRSLRKLKRNVYRFRRWGLRTHSRYGRNMIDKEEG